ncbi:helicase-associated domain-containing protein [Flexivirga caeni]|uniref:helicase-associated domain-containing protein n=1 Tax=Flexivirga caeni TaxID=2294115 RepID=UPI001C65688D|nr:helicase-associated domain-containing protein [Flexivirga caeni]
MIEDDPSTQTRPTDHEALANLHTMLQLCAQGSIRCSAKTCRPSAATIALVRDHLQDGDFYSGEDIAAFAWPVLLQAGGLAKLAGSRLELTAKGRAAQKNPGAETIRLLWTRWASHGVIDEFSRIEHIKGQRAKNVLTAVARRRAAVASVLDTLPPGEWITIDDLFAKMRRTGPVFGIVRNDRAIWRLYICEPEYGSLGYSGFHEWSLLEGRYTLVILLEYAATLGLLDVELRPPAGARDDFRENWGTDELDALSRYDGLHAIRLNALGAYVTGQAERYAEPPHAAQDTSLTILPNCDVVATGALTAGDRMALSAYATETTEEIWSVSAESLLAAVAAGRPLEDFERFLAERGTHEVPAPMRNLLADARFAAARLRDRGTVRLVTCSDAATASHVATELRQHCRLVDERSLLITARQEAGFRRGLLRLGLAVPPPSET